MTRVAGVAGVLIVAFVLRLPGRVAGRPSVDEVAQLRVDTTSERIRALLQSDMPRVGGQSLHALEQVREFYALRGYIPAWLVDNGLARPADRLISEIGAAETHGLDPADYHEEVLRQQRWLVSRPGHSAHDRADVDVLLTDAFLTLARHRRTGRVDPRSVHAGWTLRRQSRNLHVALREALATGEVERALRKLDPEASGYEALRRELARYLAPLPWPTIAAGAALKLGEVDPRVPLLRDRLAREADLRTNLDTSTLFDARLEKAVRMFQRDRGLEQDGVVGPVTRAALSVTASARARQIALGLERMRWLPDPDGMRYIRVELPAFELRFFEADTLVFRARIVGGRADWPTPVFASAITAVTLSPYWNVPPRILALEVLPRVRRDPGYLAQNDMHVIAGGGARPRVIDASTIEWETVRVATFPYRVRQNPGPQNPLGGVKFILPNRYDVYLHDTPARELFARATRAFSHGCMRLERPFELARLLLRDQPQWTVEAIARAAQSRSETTVLLRSPVTIQVVYRTAWIDETDGLQFRDDIYGHDQRLARALAHATTAVDAAEAPCGVAAGSSTAGDAGANAAAIL